MLVFSLRTEPALRALQELLDRAGDLSPVLKAIGDDMAEATHLRFVSATAPDGSPWAPNSAATMARYQNRFGTSLRKKDGTLNARGAAKAGGKKPLTGDSGALNKTINSQLTDNKTVAIGSNQVYAAMHQFGGRKSEFPHLWGDIPAREFLGASEADRANIVQLVRGYLAAG